MRDPQNLEELCKLQPEYIGFIFYPGSKRFVGNHPDPLLFEIPGSAIKKVGVFVDEELSQVKKIVDLYGLNAVQLHGGETAAYCKQLSGEALEVFKALNPQVSQSEFESYMEVTDHILFDSAGEGRGGTGQKFNWKLLEDLPFSASFLLSGGIGPEDAETLRDLDLKGMFGVDVNSRFELSPGMKDIELLRNFFTEIRK